MIHLVKFGEFFHFVSDNPGVKFKLVWITFGGLVVPAVLLMSVGVPEKYALPVMLAAIPLFQYGVVCILESLSHRRRITKEQREFVPPRIVLQAEIKEEEPPERSKKKASPAQAQLMFPEIGQGYTGVMAEQSTILLVEDNESSLEILTLRMVRAGYRVIQAREGMAALTKIKEEKPDLILLDLLMPGASGFEVLERMQQDSEIQNIPIIVVTAISVPEVRKRCFKLGAWDYVTKPVDFTELLIEIERCLLKKQQGCTSNLWVEAPRSLSE